MDVVDVTKEKSQVFRMGNCVADPPHPPASSKPPPTSWVAVPGTLPSLKDEMTILVLSQGAQGGWDEAPKSGH